MRAFRIVTAAAVLAAAAVLLLPADALAQRRLFRRRRPSPDPGYVLVVPPGRTYLPAAPPAPVVQSGPVVGSDYGTPADDVPANPAAAPAEASAIRPAASVQADDADAAVVRLRFPTEDAKLWVEGEQVPGTGTARRFVSPPLKPHVPYALRCKARWTENGIEVVQERKVEVYAGDRVTVDFREPAPAEPPAEIVPKEYTGPRP